MELHAIKNHHFQAYFIAASLTERIPSLACDKSNSKTLKFYRKTLKKRTIIAKLR
jgi:hypothetical protein